MSAHTINMLLDERARLVAKNAATSGDLWMAELLLTRVEKMLREAIMPTPAMSAHRDVLADEIRELLAEDREHPGKNLGLDDVSGEGGAGEEPPSPGILPNQPKPY